MSIFGFLTSNERGGSLKAIFGAVIPSHPMSSHPRDLDLEAVHEKNAARNVLNVTHL
jgi:hypothetical protein